MHIGIDVRPLQLDAYRERGIGTHLRSWIEAAQELDSGHSVSLLFDPSLPAPQVDVHSRQWKLQPIAPPFSPPQLPPASLHIDRDDEFLFDSALEAFLLEQSIDLFHSTYSFMWEAYAVRRLFKTRWIATVYDLIPLRFREEYLDPLGDAGRHSFAQRFGGTIYAQRVQTLSSASRKDLLSVTGLPAEKVDVIYGGVDKVFAPMGGGEVARELAALGVAGSYIFSVSGFHHSKNLRRLLEGYAQLPDSFRRQYRLLVLCPLSPAMRDVLSGCTSELGIRDTTQFIRQVSQRQLVALYNGAVVVVHPTLVEGFGLPILEAMRCGTPVVTSNTSAMPEIAGGAARLVDPLNSADIADGIAALVQSDDLRAELQARGFQQAARFTWEKTAQAVLDSYAQALEEPLYSLSRTFPTVRPGLSRRPHIAFWTPLNPRPSGVSDYSEALIAELGNHADVDVFVDGYEPTNVPLFDSFPTFDGKAYPYVASRHPYDMCLYQAGNNPLHRYMYHPILKWPGIVTFHDVYVYHFIHAALMLSGSAEAFWKEVEYCEGPSVARQARRDYLRGSLDDYAMPLNRHLIAKSRGVIVHSEWAKKRIERYDGAPPTRVIPFGIFTLEADGGRFGKLVRRLLGIPQEGFVFGVFGNLHPVKRIPVILSAFERVRSRKSDTCLFIMGPVNPSTSSAVHSLQQNPRAAHARGIYLYLTYASYDLMLMAMQAVDVGINLRYPTAGETSGTLSMLLGEGKPSIVSDVGSFTEYPDACCPKVPVGENEEDVLAASMLGLMESSARYTQAKLAAHAFSRERSWSRCAEQYLDFIEAVLARRSRDRGGSGEY